MKAPSEDKLNDILAEYMARPVQAKLVESDLDSSSEFKIHKPFLSRNAIKTGSQLFIQKDIGKKGWLSPDEIRELLPPIFNVDRQLPPKSDAIDTLFRKFQFGQDRKIKKLEFHRFLKDLAGYKNYDAQSISTPKVARTSNIRINFNQATPKPSSDTDLSNAILAKNTKQSALSSKSSSKAIEIFNKLDQKRSGHVKIGVLEPYIKDIFEADRSLVPSKSNIQELFRAFHYTPDQEISPSTFIQLLQQLKSNVSPQQNVPIITTSPPVVIGTKIFNDLERREAPKSMGVLNPTKTNEQRFSNNLLSEDEMQNSKNKAKQGNLPSEVVKAGPVKFPPVSISKVQGTNFQLDSKEIKVINQNNPRLTHPPLTDIQTLNSIHPTQPAPRMSYPQPSQSTINQAKTALNQMQEPYKLAHARAVTPKIVKPTIIENMLQTNKTMMTTTNLKKIKAVFKKQPLDRSGKIKLRNLNLVWDAICDLTQHPRLTSTEIHNFFTSNSLDPEMMIDWKGFKKQLKRFSDPEKYSGKQQSCLKSLF